MSDQLRFLVSFIADNQPQSMEVSWNSEAFSSDDAANLARKSFPSSTITDIQIISIHHKKNSDVHPGHYQQPEGN